MSDQLSRSAISPTPSAPPAPSSRGRRRWTFPAVVGLGLVVGAAGAGVLTLALSDDAVPPPASVAARPPASPSSPARPHEPEASTPVRPHEPGASTPAPVRLPGATHVPVAEPDPVNDAESGGSADSGRPAYLIIQDEIDRALAEREQTAQPGG